MNFFVPAARDPATAEDAWECVRCFLTEQGFPTTGRRIRRLVFTHDDERFDLEVGGFHPGMADDPPLGPEENPAIRGLVMMIFEASTRPCYYVCLPYRGVIRNYPWLVGRDAASLIEDFEPEPADHIAWEAQARRDYEERRTKDPPRDGEGDHAEHGGGGPSPASDPEAERNL